MYRRCETDVGERVENKFFNIKYSESKLRVVLGDYRMNQTKLDWFAYDKRSRRRRKEKTSTY